MSAKFGSTVPSPVLHPVPHPKKNVCLSPPTAKPHMMLVPAHHYQRTYWRATVCLQYILNNFLQRDTSHLTLSSHHTHLPPFFFFLITTAEGSAPSTEQTSDDLLDWRVRPPHPSIGDSRLLSLSISPTSDPDS